MVALGEQDRRLGSGCSWRRWRIFIETRDQPTMSDSQAAARRWHWGMFARVFFILRGAPPSRQPAAAASLVGEEDWIGPPPPRAAAGWRTIGHSIGIGSDE